MKYLRIICDLRTLLIAILLLPGDSARAGTVVGKITTASSGAVGNATLTFALTQTAVAPSSAGTSTPASIAASGVNCWTDSQGNVVGLPGGAAIGPPVLVSVATGGVLPGVLHYVKYTWSVAQPVPLPAVGESEPSAERSIVPGGGGTITVQIPLSIPANATAMNVYIGTSSGGEKLQGSAPVTNGTMASGYTQSTALVSGNPAPPSSNTAACSLRFNDELVPSYTGYNVDMVNVNAQRIPGFPQKWYLAGGAQGTVNLGSGTPLYSGMVQYPQAIVSNPPTSSTQSINGPLSLNGFPLLNTAWSPTSILFPTSIGTVQWPNGSGILDTGIYRLAAGVIGVGNQNAGDTSGTIKTSSFLAGDGTAAAPSHSFIADNSSGMHRTSTGLMLSFAGADQARIATGTVYVPANLVLNFPTGDLSLSRLASSTVGIGNGTAGDTSGSIALGGANPAQSGAIRLANTSAILWRNAGNTVDFTGIQGTSGNQLNLGYNAEIQTNGGVTLNTGVALRLGGSNDTGLSRTSAGAVGVGNGVQGDVSGQLGLSQMRASGVVEVSGNTGLASLYGATMGIYATASTPHGGAITVGDGSGWQFDFVKRTGGVSTFLFSFLDSGVFKLGSSSISSAGAGTLTLPAATDTLVARATTDTLTNKTIDAEATGNNITQPTRLWFPAAGCQNAAPTGYWDMGTATIPSAVCVTGTNVVKGLLRYTATGQSAQFHYLMPSDTKASGTMDINLLWTTSTASGTATWAVDAVCTSAGSTDDPAFTALWAPSVSTASGTANAINLASTTGLTAPCSAGQIMHLRARLATAGTATNADVYGVEIIYRRTM